MRRDLEVELVPDMGQDGEARAKESVQLTSRGAHEERNLLRKRRVSIVAFFVIVGAWAALFLASGSLQRGPSAKHLGGDFVLFLSGARVIQAGGDPYDQHVLYRAERTLLQRDHMSSPSFDPYMRVGNPPLLFWALQPVATISFDTSAKLWCLAMYTCLAAGFLGCLATMGWRRRRLPMVLFLALPQTIYAAFYGNVDGLVFLALGWSAALARRRPVIAGALLTLAFLKPQVALPGALIIALFLSSSSIRVLTGFVATSALELGLTVLTTGSASLGWWLQALTGYSQRLGAQPDIASLSGLYVYSAPDRVRLALEGLSILAVAGATIAWWWKCRTMEKTGVLQVAWLWIAWFLATPFAHFHDEVVLTLPVLAVLGRDAAWLGRWPATLTLYVLLFSILVFPTTRAHTDLQSITLLIVLACALVQWFRQHAGADEGPAPAVAQSAWA